MESDRRYYQRRLRADKLAASRAITAEARERRLRLVESFQAKLAVTA